MKVIRGDKDNTEYMPYNSFIIKFKLRDNTPPNIELKIDINLNAEVTAILLVGSMINNFPAIVNK
jgi:hypothetical protein